MTAAQLGNGINEAWSYDLDQRLTQISAGSVLNRTFAYTLRNQIATDGTANYLYDAVGRLTLDQPIGGAPYMSMQSDALPSIVQPVGRRHPITAVAIAPPTMYSVR